MANCSRIIYVSSDHTKVKQINVYKSKFFLTFIFTIIAFLICGKFTLDIIINNSHNSQIEELTRANTYLKNQLDEMNLVISEINTNLNQIESKDDELRTVLGLPELDADIRNVGIGGASFEYELTEENFAGDYSGDIYSYMTALNKIQREIKLEMSSFTSLVNTYYQKEDSLKYLPALHPLIKGRITSVMGMRKHPVLNVWRHHPGIDIAAKIGTPIYATADGVVSYARYNGGYGKIVYLKHKYGFETRYGHMSKILVRAGQRIKRGDKIGLVGDTGIVTAPHLHYEVLYKGEERDPRNFFFNDYELNELVVNRQ